MARPRICSIDGCGRPVVGWGWCKSHYYRWRDHGDPLGGRTPYGLPLKFLEFAIASDTDDCILWPYSTNGAPGYGMINLRVDGAKVKELTHRFVCERVHGPKPFPLAEVAHSCGVKLCCNPRHLRWDTRTANHADKATHGTIARGTKQGSARLTEEIVREARSLSGSVTQRELAKRYGVSQCAMSRAITGVTWGWVK